MPTPGPDFPLPPSFSHSPLGAAFLASLQLPPSRGGAPSRAGAGACACLCVCVLAPCVCALKRVPLHPVGQPSFSLVTLRPGGAAVLMCMSSPLAPLGVKEKHPALRLAAVAGGAPRCGACPRERPPGARMTTVLPGGCFLQVVVARSVVGSGGGRPLTSPTWWPTRPPGVWRTGG